MKKLKFFRICYILAIILSLVILPVSASSKTYKEEITLCNTSIQIDGNEYKSYKYGITDRPYIINDLMYVPIRSFCETLNMSVEWMQNDNVIQIKSPIVINIAPNEAYDSSEYFNQLMYVNGKLSSIKDNKISISNCTHYTQSEWEATDGGNVYYSMSGYESYTFDSSTGYFKGSGNEISITNGVIYKIYGKYVHKIELSNNRWESFYSKSMLNNNKNFTLINQLSIKTDSLIIGNYYNFIFLNQGNATGIFISV